MKTRIAPTPSGYLHEGNLLNFLLVDHYCRMTGATLRLRIDDLDRARMRAEYLEDIFRQLEWLGIRVDEGPSDPKDFEQNYSQRHRHIMYEESLSKLQKAGAPYFWCRCSRKEVALHSPDGRYPGTCRDLGLDREEAPICRLKDEGEMGDFVLWTREGYAAYQLASVVDDLLDQVDLVIRGDDLRPSSAVQAKILTWLAPEKELKVWHHPLLLDRGQKMSKSQQGSDARPCSQRFRSVKELKQAISFSTHAEALMKQAFR